MKKRLLSLLLVCALTAGNVMPVYAVPDVPAGTEAETEDNEDKGGEGVDAPSPSVVDEENTDESSVSTEEGSDQELSDDESLEDESSEDEAIAESLTEDEDSLVLVGSEPKRESEDEDFDEEDYIEHPTGYIDNPYEQIVESIGASYDEEIPLLGASEMESRYITDNLPSLRNQSSYGTCWSFSTMALAEIYALKTGLISDSSEADLSELHLAHFMYNTIPDPLGGTNGDGVERVDNDYLNNGGSLEYSSNVLASWLGVVDEETVPYSTASDVIANGIPAEKAYMMDTLHLTDCKKVLIKKDPDYVKELIKENGAVSISIYIYNSVASASSAKAYSKVNNCYYDNNHTSTNHAVTIVGWDDEFSKENFAKTPAGDGAWLIRNSWTTGGFDENQSMYGYFWLSYYDTSIKDNAYSLEFDSADNFDNNYQYDGCPTRLIGMGGTTANVFTAHGNDAGETIEAVAFDSTSANFNYNVKVYKDLDDPKKPNSGEIAAELSGKEIYPGYHTYELDEPVFVDNGEKFSVVVELTKDDGSTVSQCYETDLDWKNANNKIICHMIASAEAGQSFVSHNGITWQDIGEAYNGNFGIKAFTNNCDNGIEPESIIFKDITGESPVILALNEKYKVKYEISPANVDNRKVLWQSSNEDVVTVSERGVLTAIGLGEADITATTVAGNASNSFHVKVENRVLSISIGGSSYLEKNKEYQYSVKWEPQDAETQGNVSWSSSDTSIVEIGSDGKALCKGVGSVTITAKLDGREASVTVSCKPAAPKIKLYSDRNSVVTISWDAVDGADSYLLKGNDSDLSVNIEAVEGQEHYSYTDESYKNVAEVAYHFYDLYAYEKNVRSNISRDYVYVGPVYDITYHLGGGINSEDNPAFYRNEDYYNLMNPTPPVGYTFVGWYTDPEYTTRKYSIYSDNGALDLYAKYTPKSYTVRFNPNGGSGSSGTSYAYYGSEYTINYSYTREGYDLDGWNTKADGSGTAYPNGTSVLINEILDADQSVLNLYAQWKPKQYEITLYGHGGYYGDKISCKYTVIYGAKLGDLPAPIRKGYTLDRWTSSINGGTTYSSVSIYNFTYNMSLYAQWTPIVYKITLDPGGGTLTETEIERGYNTEYGDLETPVRPGYDFDGWYPTSEGGTKIVRTTRVTKDENHTIYAKWNAARYKVSFDTNGGDAVDFINVTYDQKYGDLPIPELDGCQFVGWYDSMDNDASLVTKDSIVKTIGNHTLYARWKSAPYEVSFNANGGNPVTGKIRVETGEPYGELPETARTGYDFEGWYTSKDDDGTEITAATVVTETAAHTLYAHWTAKTYKVTLNANGGTIDGLATKDIDATYDDKYGLSDEPVYPGYDFEGWFTAATDGTRITSASKVVTADAHTLYAHWSAASYTVTFDVNGGKALPDAEKTKSLTYNSAYGQLPVPARKGYGFAGWYTDAEAGDPVTSETVYNYTNNSTLYAHWNVILPTSISIKDTGKIYIGQELTLSASVTEPENAYTNIMWDRASEYADIISITDAGVLTALSAGSAKVKATAYDEAGNVCMDTNGQPVQAVLDIVVSEYVKPDNELRILDTGKTPSIYGSSNIKDFASDTLYGEIDGEKVGAALDWKEAKLKVGEKIKLKADFLPKEYRNGKYVDTVADREVIWHSDNAAIASVASDGTVTAKAGGRAVVTVRNRDDSLIATCKIFVYDPVTTITLNKSSATLGYNNTINLNVTSIMPTTAYQHVTWINSDDSIAVIENINDNLITVRANDKGKRGKTIITAIAEGGKSAKCTINVGMPVDKIEIRTKGNADKVAAGKTIQLTAVLNDGVKTSAPVNKSVEWEIISGTDLASISSKGLISAYKEGILEVVARSTTDVGEDGNPICSDPVSLRIYVPVKKAVISNSKLTIASGKSYDLDVDIIPAVSDANAAGAATGSELGNDLRDEIVWSLKNPSDAAYLDVDPSTGLITAVEAHSKAIPVNATFIPYGAAKPTVLTCNVTVADKQISRITLNKKSLTIGVGMTETLKASLVPNVPVENGIRWSSSAPDIVTVDYDTGTVEGISAGNAVIYVISEGLDKSGRPVMASCAVTVTDKPIAMTVSDSKGNEITSDLPSVAVKKKMALKVKLYSDTEKNILSPKQSVRYESLDPRIAKIDAKGNVMGVSGGSTVIRISAAYAPELYVEKTVTVYTAAKKVILDKKKSNMSTVIDDENYDSSYAQYDVLTAMTDSDKLNAALEGDYGKIVWTLSDPAMAELASIDPKILADCVTSEDKQKELAKLEDDFALYDPTSPITTEYGKSLAVKALKPGTLKITAKDPYSGKKAVCTIKIYTHVNGLNVIVSSPKKASIEDGTMTIKVKGKATLKSTVLTSEQTTAKYIVNRNVSYRSSDPRTVSVDKKGRIKGLQKGTAIVTVTTADGGVEKKITVNVD